MFSVITLQVHVEAFCDYNDLQSLYSPSVLLQALGRAELCQFTGLLHHCLCCLANCSAIL